MNIGYTVLMYKGRHPSPRSQKRPETAREGAQSIQQYALKLFATSNGEAVDWSMMAESLFKVAFHCLDHTTDPDRRAAILRRLEAGTYDRMAGNKTVAAPLPETPAPPPHNRLDPPALGPGFSF